MDIHQYGDKQTNGHILQILHYILGLRITWYILAFRAFDIFKRNKLNNPKPRQKYGSKLSLFNLYFACIFILKLESNIM